MKILKIDEYIRKKLQFIMDFYKSINVEITYERIIDYMSDMIKAIEYHKRYENTMLIPNFLPVKPHCNITKNSENGVYKMYIYPKLYMFLQQKKLDLKKLDRLIEFFRRKTIQDARRRPKDIIILDLE
jgi:hypothetical protein